MVCVRDYGPGIPEDDLENVKKKFYKGQSKERGSGIGLAVCEEIIALQNERLVAQVKHVYENVAYYRNLMDEKGVKPEDITIMTVPGSFELIYGASQMVKKELDGVIAIGCVIRGDTPHDRYICQGVTYGLSRLNAVQDIPVIYGLITTLDMQQAEDRCGGKLGNKGDECAVCAIKMIDFARQLKK